MLSYKGDNCCLSPLQVHGLLHLLGFDHEISDEAEAEMEKEEELLLKSLGWKGKGLIQSAYGAEDAGSPPLTNIGNVPNKNKKIVALFVKLLSSSYVVILYCKFMFPINGIEELILHVNCVKTGRKKGVFDFTDQSLATSSVIWMVRKKV